MHCRFALYQYEFEKFRKRSALNSYFDILLWPSRFRACFLQNKNSKFIAQRDVLPRASRFRNIRVQTWLAKVNRFALLGDYSEIVLRKLWISILFRKVRFYFAQKDSGTDCAQSGNRDKLWITKYTILYVAFAHFIINI